ncbi:hypothetical protein [Gaetbulibacter sp. PBL-D1]|uniref:hypothetical protein n=1 Tax=Gaetbulibacter sp. PBL-D1 TaxID=3422594 RepID=UPI003D2F4071
MADLSVATQGDIILKAEEVWADSQNQTEMYTADAETIKALATKQKDRTRIITQLENPELEANNVRIVWLDSCGETLDDDCQEVCDFTASDIALAYKDVNLSKCKSASFQINENDLLRNRYTLEELVAQKLLTKTKALDEWINAQSLLFLSANAGYNKNAETYTLSGSTLQIPTADYTNDLYVKMAIDAKLNKLVDPFIVDNGALYRYYLKAQLDQGNSDGKGDKQRTMLFDTYFDLVGFPTAPVTDDTFLISSSAYAFASRNYFTDKPTDHHPKEGKQTRFTIPSRNIPGLKYDVVYEYSCSGKRFIHKYYIEANFDFVLNPVGCDILVDTEPDVFDQVTGILSYTKVA